MIGTMIVSMMVGALATLGGIWYNNPVGFVFGFLYLGISVVSALLYREEDRDGGVSPA
jgi:hypothetical protein